MSSALSEIPAAKRQHVAAVLGLFSVLLVAVGAVAATGATSGLLIAFVTVAFTVALVLALLAWGVLTSVRNDAAAQQHELALDTAVAEALASAGHLGGPGASHGCGHDHDPSELHVTGDPCQHDGIGARAGLGCSQTCDTCVFSRGARRPSPAPARPRPAPSARR